MKILLDYPVRPTWFTNFRQEEWSSELDQLHKQSRDDTDYLDRLVEFYNQKGITASACREGHQHVCLEIDLNDPEWTLRMLKYAGE